MSNPCYQDLHLYNLKYVPSLNMEYSDKEGNDRDVPPNGDEENYL